MCSPELAIKVQRHAQYRITYKDLQWQTQSMLLMDDLSELLQHECDHLDGILAVSRAIDNHSFALKNQLGLAHNNRR